MKPSDVAGLKDSAIVKMAATVFRGIYTEGDVFWNLYQDLDARLDGMAEILEEQEASRWQIHGPWKR